MRPRPAPGTSGWSSLVLLHLAPVCDGKLVLSLPDEADSLAFLGERLGRGRREILLRDDELRARVERDPVARIGPQIRDCPDAARRGAFIAANGRVGFGQVDLLGADRE